MKITLRLFAFCVLVRNKYNRYVCANKTSNLEFIRAISAFYALSAPLFVGNKFYLFKLLPAVRAAMENYNYNA